MVYQSNIPRVVVRTLPDGSTLYGLPLPHISPDVATSSASNYEAYVTIDTAHNRIVDMYNVYVEDYELVQYIHAGNDVDGVELCKIMDTTTSLPPYDAPIDLVEDGGGENKDGYPGDNVIEVDVKDLEDDLPSKDEIINADINLEDDVSDMPEPPTEIRGGDSNWTNGNSNNAQTRLSNGVNDNERKKPNSILRNTSIFVAVLICLAVIASVALSALDIKMPWDGGDEASMEQIVKKVIDLCNNGEGTSGRFNESFGCDPNTINFISTDNIDQWAENKKTKRAVNVVTSDDDDYTISVHAVFDKRVLNRDEKSLNSSAKLTCFEVYANFNSTSQKNECYTMCADRLVELGCRRQFENSEGQVLRSKDGNYMYILCHERYKDEKGFGILIKPFSKNSADYHKLDFEKKANAKAPKEPSQPEPEKTESQNEAQPVVEPEPEPAPAVQEPTPVAPVETAPQNGDGKEWHIEDMPSNDNGNRKKWHIEPSSPQPADNAPKRYHIGEQ